MWAQEAQDWKTKMDNAIPGSAEFELYKANWESAETSAREAQDKMLSDLATWAEAEKALLENTLADLGRSLEESLTGGSTFDELTTQMERAQSLQEEYLTTTNKIYNTTKMMRTAQQAIDASTNVVAQQKLKGFIAETKSLQEKGKLSQYELDMQ
jgi:multidrug resistance efflux pump